MDNPELLGEHELCAVGDWFALGSVFTPFSVQKDGQVFTGMRQILCIDVASHYVMDFVTLPSTPGTLLSRDILFFVAKVMTEKGMPRKGFILLKSAVLSSDELAQDPDTIAQGLFLRSIQANFPAMTDTDRETFRARMGTVNLKVAFHGLRRVEADATLCFTELSKTGVMPGFANT